MNAQDKVFRQAYKDLNTIDWVTWLGSPMMYDTTLNCARTAEDQLDKLEWEQRYGEVASLRLLHV